MLLETSNVCVDNVIGRNTFFWHILVWEQEEPKPKPAFSFLLYSQVLRT